MILSLSEARAKFPHYHPDACEDPRHRDGDDTEAVAAVETRDDLYAVCECCLARIEESR